MVTSYGAAGRSAFEQESARFYKTAIALESAKGATYISHANAAANSVSFASGWVDDSDDSRGDRYNTEYSALSNDEITGVQYIIFNLGQSDIQNINTHDEDRYTQLLETLFSFYKADFPNLRKIFIEPAGRYKAGGKDTHKNLVRNAQLRAIENLDYVELASEAYDVTHIDSWHPDQAGNELRGIRHARRLAHQDGILSSGGLGPSMTAATLSGTTVSCTIAHDSGTDITAPSAGHSMFGVESDGVFISISSVTRISATQIDIELASTPGGTVNILYTNYGDGSAISDGDVFKDNATPPMPLRTQNINIS